MKSRQSAATLHPLEPLTGSEVEAAIKIVKADARGTDACHSLMTTRP